MTWHHRRDGEQLCSVGALPRVTAALAVGKVADLHKKNFLSISAMVGSLWEIKKVEVYYSQTSNPLYHLVLLLLWLPSMQVLRTPVRSTSARVKHYSTSACMRYLLTYCHTAADVDKMLRQSLFTVGIHLAVGMPFSPQSLPRPNTALCFL